MARFAFDVRDDDSLVLADIRELLYILVATKSPFSGAMERFRKERMIEVPTEKRRRG